jgi:hypothetical protein
VVFDDIKVLTDSLGYVMSQASAFLLDADDPASYDFPAHYVVLNFKTPPPIAVSAALFRKVGEIDDELFNTDTSGYTQIRPRLFVPAVGRARWTVHRRLRGGGSVRRSIHASRQQPAVAVRRPRSLSGQRLGRVHSRAGIPGAHPAKSHKALARIRAFHLRVTREVLRDLEHHDKKHDDDILSFDCRR